jgi:hypothetical protein
VERYLSDYAPAMREDGLRRWGAAVTYSRRVLLVQAIYTAP